MAVKRTKSGTRSLLADAAAGKILKDAAGSVGLSLEELVNLAADAGAVLCPPKPDHGTERYTLEDLGGRMWTLASTTPPSERPGWFDDLVETQKVALLVFLREKGFTTTTIAREFELEPVEVQGTYNRFADELGTQVINVRLNTIVGQLQLAAERAGEGAMQKDDWSAYWRIQKEMVGLMQSLGIIDRAIHRSEVEVKHTHDHEHLVKFEAQANAEVDRIVQLKLKKHAREEEIRQVEAKVLDPTVEKVPVELEPKVLQLAMSEPFGMSDEYLEDVDDAE